MPARLGPARRHYHVLDQLSRFYDVHLISSGSASEAEVFSRDLGTRVRDFQFAAGRDTRGRKALRKIGRTLTGRCDFLPALEPTLRRVCAQVTSAQRFDAIVLSSVLLRGLPLPDDIPVVGDTHNAEFDVLRRTAALSDRFLLRRYATWQWPATRREEQRCGHDVDLVLATSDRDRQVFEEELGLRGVEVIPNGIDLTEFLPPPAPPRAGTIVFSGLMSYYPNQQAIQWFLDEIFPAIVREVPSASVIVAGANAPRWLMARASDRVEVTGSVPDIRPYLERASVVIAPLLIGGGTRVKILQAQAMARPVVSTSLGAEGLELRDGESVLIADDAASFAARVVDLLNDTRLAAGIASNGRNHVVRHFDWNRIGDTLSVLLQTRLGLTARHARVEEVVLS